MIQLQRHPTLPGIADTTIWQRVHFPEALGSTTGRALTATPAIPADRHDVFVRAHDAHGIALAKSMGVRLNANTWMPARLSLTEMRAALALAGGLDMRTAPFHKPLLDRSVLEIGADLVQHGMGRMPARTGKGVLVGLIDTGLDLNHPAFHRADGSSRIVATWDQDNRYGITPPGYNYGSYCDAAMIAAQRCFFFDSMGHGTHVAGIAAGSADPLGIASDADIAMVRSDRFTRMGDALLFLIHLADQRKQPLVINVSVGGQYGPHDGRTPLEQYITYLTSPGRVLVAAAGNHGADPIHVVSRLISNTPKRVALDGLPITDMGAVTVELWTEPSTSLSLTLEVWRDQQLRISVPLTTGRSELLHGDVAAQGMNIGALSYGVEYVDEHQANRHTLMLDRSFGDPLDATTTIALKLEGDGQVHAWINASSESIGLARFGVGYGDGWIDGDSNASITVPATAHNVIAVGSYVTRTQWHSEWLGDQSLTLGTFGDRASYSSFGPTLLPAMTGFKPNISAPGSVIVSARARTVPTSTETVDDQQMAMQGTSMSAPHVTGVVALMLEANPELSPLKAMAILQSTSRQDTFTGPVPNAAWGHGKIDAYAAVTLAEQRSSGGCNTFSITRTLWPLCCAYVVMMVQRVRRKALHKMKIQGSDELSRSSSSARNAKLNVMLPRICVSLRHRPHPS